jgi:hypothetical protein
MTLTQLRAAFWAHNPHLPRKPGRQNAQHADTRAAWCEYVDAMARAGTISDSLAKRATL